MLGISDMTLNSFVRTECANLTRTNECIGIDEMCVIIKKKKECKYFKTCVLPIAEHQGIYSKILSEYSDIDKSMVVKLQTRFCGCGTELIPRQRCCDNCRRKRRQKTKHVNYLKSRGSD